MSVVHERGGRQRGRLPAFDDGGDDVRGQVAQPQQAGDIRGGHLLGRRDLGQRERGRLRQPIMDCEGTPQQPDQARVRVGKVLAGLSFMRSWGDLEYTDDGVAGVLESRMNTVHPYVYWQPSARLGEPQGPVLASVQHARCELLR